MSYLKAHARELGLDPDEFESLDVHIHVPEGAIPKDGPSAGITIASRIGFSVHQTTGIQNVCMSGEITLRGSGDCQLAVCGRKCWRRIAPV